MCKSETTPTSNQQSKKKKSKNKNKILDNSKKVITNESTSTCYKTDTCIGIESMSKKNQITRRGKRVKQNELKKLSSNNNGDEYVIVKKKVKTGSCSRHEGDSHSGGLDALLPSFIAIVVIGCGIIAKMGFRGRATVAGIDLGTTNSVICVQEQSHGSEG